MSSTSALQKAAFQTLTADPALTALIGPGRVFDDVPPATRPPYLVFAESGFSDWRTGSEDGEAHLVSVDAWSAERGRKQVAAIAGAVRAALGQIGPLDAPWRLVLLRHVTTRIGRDPQTEYYRAVLSFSALIELQEE